MKKILLNLLLCSSVIWSGCATVFTSDSQNITFSSEPEGANIKVGPYECVTPCALEIPKGKNYTIAATYDDQKKVVPLTTKMAGSTLINIIFWPGFIVDALTGNIKKYNPSHYNFAFESGKGEEK